MNLPSAEWRAECWEELGEERYDFSRVAADITALELPHGEVGRHVCGSCFRKNLKRMHVRTWGANGEKERARREKRRRQEEKEAGRKKKKKKAKKGKKAGGKTGCACCGKGFGKQRSHNLPEKVVVGLEHRGKGFEKLCNACYQRNRKWLKHGVPANPVGRVEHLPPGTKVGCAGCGTFPIPVGKDRFKIPEGNALAIEVQRSATHCRLCNKCGQENERRAAGVKKANRLPPGTKMGCAACGEDIPEGKNRYNYPAELLLDLDYEGPGHSRLCQKCYQKNRRAVKRKKEKKRKREEEEEEEPEKRKRGKK